MRHAVEQVVARRRPIASVQPDEQALERAERATSSAELEAIPVASIRPRGIRPKTGQKVARTQKIVDS